jgi:hypothetical protein
VLEEVLDEELGDALDAELEVEDGELDEFEVESLLAAFLYESDR